MRHPALLLLSLLTASCADISPLFVDSGAPNVDAGETCTEGVSRCVDRSYQHCASGTFTHVLTCDETRVCAAGLGCVDCDPSRERTCAGNAIHACDPGGHLGARIDDCLGRACFDGACLDAPCAAGAKLIYVVDSDYRLLSFDPAAEDNPFRLIATLTCPAVLPSRRQGGTATPFSMSVDRSARAWVLYSSGELFWVNTTTGACTAAPYTPGQDGFGLFGMGFVADAPGSSKEKLYAASSRIDRRSGLEQLGYIDPGSLQLTVVGPTPQAEYSPELSGTGSAELYAYYPGAGASFVTRLDKATGQELQRWSVPVVLGQVTAWAFAHWGGKFYIFVTFSDGASEISRVLRLDPASGQGQVFLPGTPYKIVGAGVSTCAPIIE